MVGTPSLRSIVLAADFGHAPGRMGSGEFPSEAATARTCGANASSRRSRRRDIAAALLLGIVAFLIYNANFRSISAADTYAARHLPFSIWRHQTLVLDPIATPVAFG